MNKYIVGSLVAVAIIAVGGYFFPQVEAVLGNKTASFWDTAEGYRVDGTTVINGSGQLTIGSTLAGIRTGSCTIWDDSTTIAATSTSQVECQSATDGSIGSSLTGVTADSNCSLTMASSTNTTIASILVGGASASSTAGSIVARIVNLTGTTFTWSAAASSSNNWRYICLDPA